MEHNPEQPRKQRSRWALVGLNLIIMAVIGFVLGWLALAWLDVWTGHGHEAVVPDVCGRSYESAVAELELQGFTVEITDSVYDTHARPGYVVDQNPRRNTKVKPGRLIYLTINAVSPKTVTIPSLTDISARQAEAILMGLGVKNVTRESVLSEFKDLVLSVTYNGRPLSAGARVPVNARIVLHVGSGMDTFENGDSLASDQPEATVERYDLF